MPNLKVLNLINNWIQEDYYKLIKQFAKKYQINISIQKPTYNCIQQENSSLEQVASSHEQLAGSPQQQKQKTIQNSNLIQKTYSYDSQYDQSKTNDSLITVLKNIKDPIINIKRENLLHENYYTLKHDREDRQMKKNQFFEDLSLSSLQNEMQIIITDRYFIEKRSYSFNQFLQGLEEINQFEISQIINCSDLSLNHDSQYIIKWGDDFFDEYYQIQTIFNWLNIRNWIKFFKEQDSLLQIE